MLDWIQSSGIAHLVQTSLWGYIVVLSSHAIGMAILAGLALMINLRLLGLAPDVPLPPLRRMIRFALAGFAINFVSGAMLFAADAYYFVENWPFRIKIGLLLLSGALLIVIYRRLGQDPGTAQLRAGRVLPAIAIAGWIGVIASGRLVAYL